MASQDKDTLAKLISSKASGDLGQIRKGTSDGRNLAKAYGAMKVGKVVQGSRGDERLVVLEGGADSKNRKQMKLRKEDGGWKVFEIPPAPK